MLLIFMIYMYFQMENIFSRSKEEVLFDFFFKCWHFPLHNIKFK